MASLAIVMLGACLVSFLVAFFVPRRQPEDRSAGLLLPLMGRLSACVINRSREARALCDVIGAARCVAFPRRQGINRRL